MAECRALAKRFTARVAQRLLRLLTAISAGGYAVLVHIIGVNWPHHVFVDTSFKVVGAE